MRNVSVRTFNQKVSAWKYFIRRVNDIRLSIIIFLFQQINLNCSNFKSSYLTSFKMLIFSANQLKSLHGRFVFHYIVNFPERISIGRSNFYLLRCPEKGEIVDEVKHRFKKQLSETRMPILNLLDQCFFNLASAQTFEG